MSVVESRQCYVCDKPVELSEPDKHDVVAELDENDHCICKPCQKLASDITDDVADWPSSEDRECFLENVAVEALRLGRRATHW